MAFVLLNTSSEQGCHKTPVMHACSIHIDQYDLGCVKRHSQDVEKGLCSDSALGTAHVKLRQPAIFVPLVGCHRCKNTA